MVERQIRYSYGVDKVVHRGLRSFGSPVNRLFHSFKHMGKFALGKFIIRPASQQPAVTAPPRRHSQLFAAGDPLVGHFLGDLRFRQGYRHHIIGQHIEISPVHPALKVRLRHRLGIGNDAGKIHRVVIPRRVQLLGQRLVDFDFPEERLHLSGRHAKQRFTGAIGYVHFFETFLAERFELLHHRFQIHGLISSLPRVHLSLH
ncbi:hypothetical protein D1872_249250 [compost metagenome]